MNEQLKIFNFGDIVAGKVIAIETSRALIEIEGCDPVYIPKPAISSLKIKTIQEILDLDRIYEFLIVEDKGGQFYNYCDLYISIVDLEYKRTKNRIEQLAAENVTIYSEVIKAYDYGVIVNIESRDFLVSNVHLKTDVSNQELVGTVIPLKIILIKSNNHYYTQAVVSHRWALLDDSPNSKPYAYGNTVIGKVIELGKDYALIDIGAEKPAYIALKYMSYGIEFAAEVLHLNLVREFLVSTIYHQRYTTLGLSIIDLERKIGWLRLEQIEREKAIFFARIIEKTRYGSGFVVKAEGISAILPLSHLGSNINPEEILNKKIPIQILEYKPKLYRLVVSHRIALFRLRLMQIKLGDLLSGKVVAIREYGLFVDIGNGSVLLHISEITQAAMDNINLNSIFQIDDEIKAIVIAMDIKKGRVAVSTKELELESGDMLRNPQLVYTNAAKMANRYRQLVIERLV